MDAALYLSSLQDRSFLALGGIALSLAVDGFHWLTLGHRADPRPLLERLADMMLFSFAARLNRAGRPDGALILRGAMVLAIGVCVFFAAIAGAYITARHYGQGGFFLSVLIAFSTTTLGWFGPLRALARIAQNPGSPRPYMVLARATYSNLVTLDDSGIVRVSVTGAARSLVIRMAAPLLLFVLFGWQVLAIYWPVMMLSLATGRDGRSRSFAAVINVLASILLFLPTLLMFPVVLVSLLFSAGSSFFRAIPGFFRVHKWPPLLQGGVVVMLVAYAMKLALGGPRQDRGGTGVIAEWTGPSAGTARLEPRDISRFLYLNGVTLLLTTAFLFLVAVI